MSNQSKAQRGEEASGHHSARAASVLHELYNGVGFDFINTMLGRTVEAVSARLGIGFPDKWGDPVLSPTPEDFARWLDKVPPIFDPDDVPAEDKKTPGGAQSGTRPFPPLTYERVSTLVKAIVPYDGSVNEDTSGTARALNELLTGLVDEDREREEEPGLLVYHASVAAFEQTAEHYDILSAWAAVPYTDAGEGASDEG